MVESNGTRNFQDFRVRRLKKIWRGPGIFANPWNCSHEIPNRRPDQTWLSKGQAERILSPFPFMEVNPGCKIQPASTSLKNLTSNRINAVVIVYFDLLDYQANSLELQITSATLNPKTLNRERKTSARCKLAENCTSPVCLRQTRNKFKNWITPHV